MTKICKYDGEPSNGYYTPESMLKELLSTINQTIPSKRRPTTLPSGVWTFHSLDRSTYFRYSIQHPKSVQTIINHTNFPPVRCKCNTSQQIPSNKGWKVKNGIASTLYFWDNGNTFIPSLYVADFVNCIYFGVHSPFERY